jgi:DNA-damage-inducible protein J
MGTYMKNAMIRARVSEELKSQAEAIMEEVGINPTQAITMFYKQLVFHKGLPFEVKIPNQVTLAAMESDDLIEYSSTEEMFDDRDS